MFEIQLLSEVEWFRFTSGGKMFSVYLNLFSFFSWDDQSFEPQTVSQLKALLILLEKKPCPGLQSEPARPTEPSLSHTKSFHMKERDATQDWCFSISTGPNFQKVMSFWPVGLLEPLLFTCKPTLQVCGISTVCSHKFSPHLWVLFSPHLWKWSTATEQQSSFKMTISVLNTQEYIWSLSGRYQSYLVK